MGKPRLGSPYCKTSPGLALLKARFLSVRSGFSPQLETPPPTLSAQDQQTRPGEEAAQLMVSMHVSRARNEPYHHGRIRRKCH